MTGLFCCQIELNWRPEGKIRSTDLLVYCDIFLRIHSGKVFLKVWNCIACVKTQLLLILLMSYWYWLILTNHLCLSVYCDHVNLFPFHKHLHHFVSSLQCFNLSSGDCTSLLSGHNHFSLKIKGTWWFSEDASNCSRSMEYAVKGEIGRRYSCNLGKTHLECLCRPVLARGALGGALRCRARERREKLRTGKAAPIKGDLRLSDRLMRD